MQAFFKYLYIFFSQIWTNRISGPDYVRLKRFSAHFSSCKIFGGSVDFLFFLRKRRGICPNFPFSSAFFPYLNGAQQFTVRLLINSNFLIGESYSVMQGASADELLNAQRIILYMPKFYRYLSLSTLLLILVLAMTAPCFANEQQTTSLHSDAPFSSHVHRHFRVREGLPSNWIGMITDV